MFHKKLFNLVIVQTEEELTKLKWLLKSAQYHFWDTETSGLRVRFPGNDFAVGWTFAVEDETDPTNSVYYVPVGHAYEGVYESHVGNSGSKIKLQLTDDDEAEWIGKEYYNVDPALFNKVILPLLSELGHVKIAHNQMYDWHVLANEGVDVPSFARHYEYDDTQVMYHMVDEEGEKKLESIVKKCYGILKADYNCVVATVSNAEKVEAGLKANNKANFPLVSIPVGAQYSAEDVWFMKQLYFELINWMEEEGQWEIYQKYRRPLVLNLWKMEREGVDFDKKKAEEMQRLAEIELDKFKYQLFELAGVEFNVSSGQQVGEILFGHKKIIKDKKTGAYKESYNQHLVDASFNFPVQAWTDGGKEKDKKLKIPKTDDDSLEDLLKLEYKDKKKKRGQEFVRIMQDFNNLNKVYSTYIVGMQNELYQDGKIHCSFNITGTTSGRMSCSEPNLQNLKRPLELPKEPKELDFEDSIEYRKKLRKYRKEKMEYDFWIRFEIRELIYEPDEERILIALDLIL